MVWWLKAEFSPGPGPFYFTQPGTYTVGRKDCTIVIPADKTISRLHAEITVSAASRLGSANDNHEKAPECGFLLKDSSKFGTFVNKEVGSNPLSSLPDKRILLKEGDVITFGINKVAFRLHDLRLKLCIMPSTTGSTTDLRSNVEAVGGYVVEQWNDQCTHLLVEGKSEVTDLVIAAVLNKKLVLQVEWLQALMSQKSPIDQLPIYSSYLPMLSVSSEGEHLRTSIAEPYLREGVLRGYKIFLKEGCLYKRSELATMVRVAGGTVTLFTLHNLKDVAGRVQENGLLIFPADRGSCKTWLGSKIMPFVHHLHPMSEDLLLCSILAADLKLPLVCFSPDGAVDSDETVDLDDPTAEDDSDSSELHENIQNAQSKPDFANLALLNKVKESNAPYQPGEVMEAKPVPGSQPAESSKLLEKTTSQPTIRVESRSDGAAKPKTIEPLMDQPGHSTIDERPLKSTSKTEEDAPPMLEVAADIVFTTGLIVRTERPPSPSLARDGIVPNFKRFKKGGASHGNSFNSLVPFANEPYRESDYAREMQEFMRQEKKRKEAELVADDLFNAEKLKRSRGAAAKGAGAAIFAQSRRH